jgi:hypothetical protein
MKAKVQLVEQAIAHKNEIDVKIMEVGKWGPLIASTTYAGHSFYSTGYKRRCGDTHSITRSTCSPMAKVQLVE